MKLTRTETKPSSGLGTGKTSKPHTIGLFERFVMDIKVTPELVWLSVLTVTLHNQRGYGYHDALARASMAVKDFKINFPEKTSKS